MGSAAETFPMRWPARWSDPALLDLLKNTPINLLLLPHNSDLAAVRAEARRLGLACWRLASGQPVGSEEVRIQPRSGLDWMTGETVVAAGECVWPSIASEAQGSAGPTGVPWVDSNGWFAQLAGAMLPGRQIWLVFDPPSATVLRPESYALAVADSEAYGARWVISLDEQAESDAFLSRPILQAISIALRFFGQHRAWATYAPRAALGVLSDYSGENRFMAEEVLNLLARRHLPFRVLVKQRASQLEMGGLKAVIYPDGQPPVPELERRLLDFVRQGGLLIAGPVWRAREGTRGPEDVHRRFDVFLLGKGRLAVAKDSFSDPYLVALDAHLLLGRRHDLIRLWNGGSLNVHYTAERGDKRAVVQLINYATRQPAHQVTLGLTAQWRRAWFWEPGAGKARPLEILPAPQGIEVALPPFPVYAAVELEA